MRERECPRSPSCFLPSISERCERRCLGTKELKRQAFMGPREKWFVSFGSRLSCEPALLSVLLRHGPNWKDVAVGVSTIRSGRLRSVVVHHCPVFPPMAPSIVSERIHAARVHVLVPPSACCEAWRRHMESCLAQHCLRTPVLHVSRATNSYDRCRETLAQKYLLFHFSTLSEAQGVE